MPSFARVVTAPIGAGIFVALLWWIVNSMAGGPGRGWLEQKPWPFSSLVACAAIAAGLTFLQALLGWWRAHRRSADLSFEAARLRLEYQANVVRADLGGALRLRVFEHWYEAWNRMWGQFEGVDVQMIDFTSLQRSPHRQRSHSHSESRTVVVIPLPAKPWPVFEIHPRGFATWMWDLLGCPGVRFNFRDAHLASNRDRDTLRRFNRRYRLFVGVAERIAELAGAPMGVSMGKTPTGEAEIGERFSLSTIQRFAHSRGWTVESCGSHVAFWRSGRIVPADDREAFLREAVDLYRVLAEPATGAADANLSVEATDFDQASLGRRMAGLIAGALVGMVLAMAVCVPLLVAMPFEAARWFVFAWPVLGMAFMAAGAYLGARFSSGTRDGM